MKLMFNHQYLQMFAFKLNKITVILTHLKLWVAVARHNFTWLDIVIVFSDENLGYENLYYFFQSLKG